MRRWMKDWNKLNPILADGEVGEIIGMLDTKTGDGKTAWKDLSFTGSVPSDANSFVTVDEEGKLSVDGELLTPEAFPDGLGAPAVSAARFYAYAELTTFTTGADLAWNLGDGTSDWSVDATSGMPVCTRSGRFLVVMSASGSADQPVMFNAPQGTSDGASLYLSEEVNRGAYTFVLDLVANTPLGQIYGDFPGAAPTTLSSANVSLVITRLCDIPT